MPVSQPPIPEIKFCPGCGTGLKGATKFCAECGFDFGAMTARSSVGPTIVVIAAAALFVGGIVWVAARRGTPTVPSAATPRGPADVMTQAATQGQGVASTAAGPGNPKVAKEQIEVALKPLRDRAKADPSSIDAKLKLGYGVYRASSLLPDYLPEAEGIFKDLLAKDPENLDAIVALANVYFDSERPRDAIPLYEKFLAKNPDEASVRTDLGTMYLYAQRTDDAIREYQKVIAAKPDFVNAYYNLGNAFHAKGDKEKALEAYRKAQTLNPPDDLKQELENVVANLEGRAPKTVVASAAPGELPPGHPPLDGGAMPGTAPAAEVPSGPRGDVEAVFRNHQILGPKVTRFEWDNDLSVKVWVSGFPMDQMPEGMRTMFLSKVGAQLAEIHKKAGNAEVYRAELVDEATGAVMATTEG